LLDRLEIRISEAEQRVGRLKRRHDDRLAVAAMRWWWR
jgi:hypothetical protein